MPELAAHLERVARELSEQVVRALFDQGYLTGPTQDRLDAEDIAGEALKAGLAAALAACAREEARFWAEEGGHVADGSSECIYCARLAERAVGEKAAPEGNSRA